MNSDPWPVLLSGDRAFFWPLGPETDRRLLERLESILGSSSGPQFERIAALCEAFDVIVVRRVPRFASSDENAARRFASLVDVMYDRQKRLLCSIDAPPGELFASIREQYSGGVDDEQGASQVRTPSHGGSSGKHVAQFRLPQSVKYTETGRYSTDGSEATK
ncbi:Afg1l, partial [Symbiodinium microadriaticum]